MLGVFVHFTLIKRGFGLSVCAQYTLMSACVCVCVHLAQGFLEVREMSQVNDGPSFFLSFFLPTYFFSIFVCLDLLSLPLFFFKIVYPPFKVETQ